MRTIRRSIHLVLLITMAFHQRKIFVIYVYIYISILLDIRYSFSLEFYAILFSFILQLNGEKKSHELKNV